MPNAQLVTALLEALREEGSYVLASPEEADFFRKKKLKLEPPRQAIQPPELPREIPPPQVEPTPEIAKSPLLPQVERKPEIAKAAPLPRVESQGEIAKAPPPGPARQPPIQPPVPVELPRPIFEPSKVAKVVAAVAPDLPVLKEIPSDLDARKIAERWRTKNQSAPISLLLFQEPPEQRALLEQMAKAIDLYFGPAKTVNGETIEKEKQWEAFLSVTGLKMIIVCDYTLWQLHGLMQFYKETPAQGTRMLKDVPLFLLPDLSLYLKDPLLKRSLWKALCQKLS